MHCYELDIMTLLVNVLGVHFKCFTEVCCLVSDVFEHLYLMFSEPFKGNAPQLSSAWVW